MSTNQKISNLTQRRDEVQRELADISASKGQTENSALNDLESCLNAELAKIDRELNQLREYLRNVEGSSEAP
ncbi:MAG TPA: hypothetical protein VMV81_07055 [Phycisphaerae bacterium]|nr:hypothetical protein [Phycisphaerae bacterium]